MRSRFLQRDKDLGQTYLSDTPKKVLKVHRNVFKSLWKKFQFKRWRLFRIFQLLFWAFFLIFFLRWHFFQRPLKSFLWTLRTFSVYLKGPSDLNLYPSKKIVTTRQTNQVICQKKWKKLRFWKNEAQNGVGIFWQNVTFWAETFFNVPKPQVSDFWWSYKNLTALLGPGKSPSQTVRQSDMNWLL